MGSCWIKLIRLEVTDNQNRHVVTLLRKRHVVSGGQNFCRFCWSDLLLFFFKLYVVLVGEDCRRFCWNYMSFSLIISNDQSLTASLLSCFNPIMPRNRARVFTSVGRCHSSIFIYILVDEFSFEFICFIWRDIHVFHVCLLIKNLSSYWAFGSRF